MGILFALGAIIFLAILGKSLVGFSLVLPLVLAVSFKASAEQSFLLAFFGGLVVGFVDGSLLGRVSVGLLLASGLIHLYGRRFSKKHWAFTLVFAALGSVVYSWVSGRYLRLPQIAIDAGLVGASLPLVSWWRERFFQDSIVLKV